MAKSAVGDFVAALRESELLEPEQLGEVSSLESRHSDPRELARHIMQRGWLTPYQVNQLILGKANDLILGQYQLMERLGEGGMGQVFKAKQRRLDRIVALKIIRKEKLDNPKTVDRFKREIRAAGKLSHPNIVMAFDADQVGQTHFFAMEYVPGVDLSRIVKDFGPLPVEAACDYIRQGAQGLEHAFERGLVHRDIKPANLLVTPPPVATDRGVKWGGTLKILDMGLARLHENRSENEFVSRLTQEGTVMGTPDFIAPEQAMNSNSADIRADLYSLGCTFYYLLTAKVPFPGGTMMEKIIRHRSEAPAPAEKIRADIPPWVLKILYTLLSKKPEDRYQTPAELAEALSSRGQSTPPPGLEPTLVSVTGLAEATAIIQGAPGATTKKRKWPRWVAVAVVVLIAILIVRGVIKKRQAASNNDKQVPALSDALDKLDPKDVDRAEGHPEELVAVLGKPSVQPEKTLGLMFGPDSRLLSGGEDSFAHLWTFPAKNNQTLTPTFRSGSVNSVAFSRDAKLIAAGSTGGGVMIWNVAHEATKLLHDWKPDAIGIGAIAFHPDGTKLATGGDDHFIRLWDITTEQPKLLYRIGEHDGAVLALAFSPDGQILASGGQDGSVRLWSPETAEGKARILSGHANDVRSLAFAPDGNTLASGSWDRTVRLWDVAKGTATTLNGHAGDINSVSFAPDGKRLASCGQGGMIVVWDLSTRKPERSWTMTWPVQAVAFAPDSRHLATANGDGTLFILRLSE